MNDTKKPPESKPPSLDALDFEFTDFDSARGSRFLRLTYCGPEADMAAVPGRIAAFLGR